MAEPPLTAGAAQFAVAVMGAPAAAPATAVPMTGALGTVAGVTGADLAEKPLVPMALVARTWKVYPVPLARPVIVLVVAAVPVSIVRNGVVAPPTTKTWIRCEVMAEPPLLTVQDSVTWPFPRVPTTLV